MLHYNLSTGIVSAGSIGESGCRKDDHCLGGALCVDGRCQCPSGYVPTPAENTKCAREGGKCTFPQSKRENVHALSCNECCLWGELCNDYCLWRGGGGGAVV